MKHSILFEPFHTSWICSQYQILNLDHSEQQHMMWTF